MIWLREYNINETLLSINQQSDTKNDHITKEKNAMMEYAISIFLMNVHLMSTSSLNIIPIK